MTLRTRRRLRPTLTATAAAALLLTGCGGAAEGTTAAKPIATLKARHVKAALPDKAALPGWTQVGKGLVDTDSYLCRVVARDACKGVTATGTTNFVRGAKRTDKWLRFSFNVYSCRTDDDARRLYKKLPAYDARPDTKKIPPLGDESTASATVLGNAQQSVSVFHDKVRVGTTVAWTYAMGSKKAVTTERAEMAAELQTDRVRQAHDGLKPTASVKVP